MCAMKLVDGIVSGERHLTKAAFEDRIARAASGLAALGAGPGDSVAILLRNDPAFLEASLAAPLPPSERFEGDPVLAHAHGRLTPVEQAQVRRRALLEVVRPCAAALLGGKVAFRPTAAASSEALRAG